MNVKLVSLTDPKFGSVISSAEEFIVYCARVSNPLNQLNTETSPKLLNYLIKHSHWSPFEVASMTVEIETSRAIAAQILRHRSFSFQEFCITGDSLITVILPKNKKPYYITIQKLFEHQYWKSYKNIEIRVFDEKTKTFTNSKIKEVFNTGEKPVYEITLNDGKKIKCTKEHKFYTQNGFDTLENIVGLDTKYHTMSKIAHIGVNGIPAYQSYEWLNSTKKESIENKKGIPHIAEKAGCSYHTIRKWLKKHKLSFSKKEVSSYTEVWNKNKFGYNTSLIVSDSHKDAIRKARSGSNSNWWKGGCDRSDRLKIADWCQTIRSKKLKEFNFSCAKCLSNKKLELDHIVPVWKDKELSYDYDNIQVLCSSCHDEKHSLDGDPKIWRQKHDGNKLTVKFTKIEKIKFLGNQQTFDLEVENKNHNYVANKILVHNSQRYSNATTLENIEWRMQGKTNRQVGDEVVNLPSSLDLRLKILQQECLDVYNSLLKEGIAKECARMILPLNTMTRIYMSGTIRSWIHYINIRTEESTQKEHRDIALEIKKILMEKFPNTSTALGWL
jgi:thymidylate synthase (FAD)